jgi:hypothetical protein
MDAGDMADQDLWVIWNGSLGVLDTVALGRIEDDAGARRAYLAPPYEVVGPFSLDELETRGRIAFGECLVMSRRRWQEDQVDLRLDARKRRGAVLPQTGADDARAHRDILNLPLDGALEPSQVRAAFRRLAKTAHPDAGGSDEDYRRIAQAREALLRTL